MRGVETVVVQRHLGCIEPALAEEFERSALSVLGSKGARKWWETSKGAFSNLCSTWADEKFASNWAQRMHAGLGLRVSNE